MVTIFYWAEDDKHYTEVDYYPHDNNRMVLFKHQNTLLGPNWGYKNLDGKFSIMPRNLYHVHKVLDPSTDTELLSAILIAKSIGNYRERG